MVTKKDFKAIAEIIKDVQSEYNDPNAKTQAQYAIQYIAADLADYFTTQNPLFDRDRFLTACGCG